MNYTGNFFVFDSEAQSDYIGRMFGYANEYYVLVCPFWDADEFLECYQLQLFDALSRGVHIFIVCRPKCYDSLCNSLGASIRPNLHIFSSKSFHAKLYFNDSAYLISSMNMSNMDSQDLGVFLLDKANPDVKYQLFMFILSLLNKKDADEFISHVECIDRDREGIYFKLPNQVILRY